MDWVIVRRLVLSASLCKLIFRIDSRVVVDFFNARDHLLEKLKEKLKFIERVVGDTEEEVISGSVVEKWMVDLENAVCDLEKLLERIGLVVEVSSQRGREEMKEEIEKELEVIFGVFALVAQGILQYLGGGSFLSALLHVLFDRMASREVVNFFNGRKLKRGLLKKLMYTTKSVEKVLDGAEEKQIIDSGVEWLNKLKHAIYEAEDLLDEIAYESLRPELKTSSQTQVRNISSSREKLKELLEVKLGEIIKRLEYLVKQKDLLGLKKGVDEKPLIVKGDKEYIMKLLLSDDANGKNVAVIPIVDTCGIGKTTLARLVYNDNRVQMCFDFKAWVCVSSDFSVYRVTKSILMQSGSKNCHTKTLDHIQLELERRLMRMKFLLVLDDVRNIEDADWEILVRCLKFAARGSKIIVTTHDEGIALVVMSSVLNQHLKELTDGDCQLLSAKHAFNEESFSADPGLEVIGKEITSKHKRLPLAAKTLGAFLLSRRDAQEWGKILLINRWNLPNDIILPALWVGYHSLPSHLKQCFAYCAIFPKGYEFQKEEVILLWMAEGLVEPCGDMEIEALAEEYFHTLVLMSFFQQSSHHRSCFVLHDLVNDLAKIVSGEFCFRLEDDGSCKTSSNTRHVSYARTEHDTSKKFTGIHDAKHLRTFLPLGWSQRWQHKRIDDQVTVGLFSELRHLRVLSLSHYHNVSDLSDSIGNLKLLRYLNLSATSITHLPEIVSTLYHLQTLILHNCRELSGLPASISKMKCLRYLNLHGTSIKGLPESMSSLHNLRTLILCQCKDLVDLPVNMGGLSNLCHLDIGGTKLQEMPPQMGKLTKLKKLTHFIVGKHSGSSIKELEKLWLLRGDLCIWKLQNVNAQDVSAANLKGKKHLKKLELRWDGVNDDSFGVLKQLQPHRNLESLSIVGYGGKRFPNWVEDSSFSNIVSLKLSGCRYCTSLPALGQLESLKDLSITEFGQVVTVGLEFYGNCMFVPFRSLKILSFAMMPQWHEWIPNLSAFPLLKELHIKECPNLTKAFPSHLPSLTTLKIEGCRQLVASLPRPSRLHSLMVDGLHFLDFLSEEMEQISCFSATLEKIIIMNCDLLKCFPLELLPKLKTFFIYGRPNLESLSALGEPLRNFEYLSSFEIGKCSRLVSFPTGGLSAPDLTVLRLRDCSSLKSLPDCMQFLLPSLMNLEIVDCPELESFPEGGLPSKLESLKIESCDKLIAARMQWNLQILPSLSHFQIVMFEDMESFPEKTLLPSTLTSLKIWDLQNLKYLDYKGLQHLTFLRELEISNCPKLESMPAERLPASLSCLSIWQCPLLEQRCKQEEGEDWPKISHIPVIEIYQLSQ